MRRSFTTAVRNFWDIHIAAENPPTLPSIREWPSIFMAYTERARADQEAHNQFMDEAVKEHGLVAVSNMSWNTPKEKAKGTQIVYKLRWQSLDQDL